MSPTKEENSSLEKERLLSQLEIIPAPILIGIAAAIENNETKVTFDNYVMSGISFLPLREYFRKNNLSGELADKLMQQLWTKFLEMSTATYPMSRNPGTEYVLLDVSRNQEQIIAESSYFFSHEAAKIIRDFSVDNDLKLSDLSASKLMIMSIGGQINASKDSTKACPIEIRNGTIFQNAPTSTELIFGAIAHKVAITFQRYLDPNNPIIIFDEGGEIFVGVDSKGTEYTGRKCTKNDLQRERILKETEVLQKKYQQQLLALDINTLEKIVNMRFELPFTIKEVIRLLKNQVDVEIKKLGKENNPDLAKVSLTESHSAIGSMDLSGISKITSRIESISDKDLLDFAQTYDLEIIDRLRHHLKIGMRKFFKHWLISSSALLEDLGCFAYEFGGDGFKALCKDQEIPLSRLIEITLQCSENWEKMLSSAQNPETESSDQKLFALFIQHQLDNKMLDNIMTKTALYPDIETRLVSYGGKMLEIKTRENIESAMELLRQFFRDHEEQLQYTNFTGHIMTFPMIIVPQSAFTAPEFASLEKNEYLETYSVAEGANEYLIIVNKKRH